MASVRRAALKRKGIDSPETLNEFLSREFRRRRLFKKITMDVVAQNSGLSKGFICDFENTVRGISVQSWYSIIEAIEECPATVLKRAIRDYEASLPI